MQAALQAPVEDVPGDPVGLGVLVAQRRDADRLAVAVIGPQALLEHVGVVGDHRVGGLQNATGGAVVLLQLDHFQVRPVFLQLGQVFRPRTAPGVDRLVVVAHHREAPLRVGEHAHQFVLGAVGVLVLVHQQVLNAMAPFLQNARLLAEQLRRHQDQVVEVHRVAGAQHAVVALIGHGGAQGVVAVGVADRLLGQDQFVLPVGDALLHRVHRRQVFLRFALTQDFLENLLAVGLVENGEAAPQAAGRQFLLENAQAQVVEGGDDQPPGGAAFGEALHPLLHFPRRLVGEGDRGDAAGGHAFLGDQPGDFAGDHAGLARTRPREHQQGAVGVEHRFLLAGVERRHRYSGGADGRSAYHSSRSAPFRSRD